MPKEDSAIDPKPTISLMFAISVGFWASQLATYITPTSEIARLRTEAKELQAWVNTKVNTHVEDFFRKRENAGELKPKIRRIQTVMQLEVRRTLGNYIDDPDESKGQDPNESKPPEEKLLSNIEGHLDSYVKKLKKLKKLELVESDLYEDANKLKDHIINKLNEYVNKISPTNRKWQWWLTLGSGLLFLIDLLCILWWYAR